jgi:hypothetical protein
VNCYQPALPQEILMVSFTAAFSTANDQIATLYGKNKSIVCRFKDYDILQFAYGHFVLTMIAQSGCDIRNDRLTKNY